MPRRLDKATLSLRQGPAAAPTFSSLFSQLPATMYSVILAGSLASFACVSNGVIVVAAGSEAPVLWTVSSGDVSQLRWEPRPFGDLCCDLSCSTFPRQPSQRPGCSRAGPGGKWQRGACRLGERRGRFLVNAGAA